MKEKEKEKEKDKEKGKASSTSETPTTTVTLKKKKTKAVSDSAATPTSDKSEEKSKGDRKSRIDAMIRTLRERSVPRAPIMTESGLIKRAVSVEDMSGTFNKCGVNKVLGIFKKFEKDESERKVLNTRSTSNIENHIANSSKERPKSIGFVFKLRAYAGFSKSKSEKSEKVAAQINDNEIEKQNANQETERGPANAAVSAKSTNSSENSNGQAHAKVCPDCSQEQETSVFSKRNTVKEPKPSNSEKDILKDERKGLMLDFSRINKEETKMRSAINGNILNNYSNLYGNSRHSNNNNNFIAESDEVNQNHLYSPSNENMTTYSSDSRSPHEEYPSSSTFFSPTEEPDLCFDDWSICSEDNYMISPSPAISRHSRISQFSSPTNLENSTESVIDRIKWRSFYCRFNEKKPKRQSNIVGPAIIVNLHLKQGHAPEKE